jgi:drug/metabolite transporter (DMT)-like permease
MGSRDDMRVPDSPIPPTLLVVALGLLASLGWGIGDFGGGLTSRRAPVLGVLGGSQVASMLVGLVLLQVIDEPAMTPQDVAVSIAAGVFGSTGLALLYRGLSTGRMGVVAPIAAVLTASIPVVFGFVTEGLPSEIAVFGIGFAVVSVILVSRAPDDGAGRPSGLTLALGAGTLFGAFSITASFLPDELLLSPLLVIRATSIVVITLWVVLGRQPWRVERRLWPALVVVGVLDMAATGAYLAAIAIGPLSIAAILSALYPVITVILAALVLRERITPAHAAGIAAAGLAVALIAGAPTAP